MWLAILWPTTVRVFSCCCYKSEQKITFHHNESNWKNCPLIYCVQYTQHMVVLHLYVRDAGSKKNNAITHKVREKTTRKTNRIFFENKVKTNLSFFPVRWFGTQDNFLVRLLTSVRNDEKAQIHLSFIVKIEKFLSALRKMNWNERTALKSSDIF